MILKVIMLKALSLILFVAFSTELAVGQGPLDPRHRPTGGSGQHQLPAAPFGALYGGPQPSAYQLNQAQVPALEATIRPEGPPRAALGWVKGTKEPGTFTVSENWSALPADVRQSALAYAKATLAEPTASPEQKQAAQTLIDLDAAARGGLEVFGGLNGNVFLTVRVEQVSGGKPVIAVTAINEIRNLGSTRPLPQESRLALEIKAQTGSVPVAPAPAPAPAGGAQPGGAAPLVAGAGTMKGFAAVPTSQPGSAVFQSGAAVTLSQGPRAGTYLSPKPIVAPHVAQVPHVVKTGDQAAAAIGMAIGVEQMTGDSTVAASLQAIVDRPETTVEVKIAIATLLINDVPMPAIVALFDAKPAQFNQNVKDAASLLNSGLTEIVPILTKAFREEETRPAMLMVDQLISLTDATAGRPGAKTEVVGALKNALSLYNSGKITAADLGKALTGSLTAAHVAPGQVVSIDALVDPLKGLGHRP